jgi:hypothetical protein
MKSVGAPCPAVGGVAVGGVAGVEGGAAVGRAVVFIALLAIAQVERESRLGIRDSADSEQRIALLPNLDSRFSNPGCLLLSFPSRATLAALVGFLLLAAL